MRHLDYLRVTELPEKLFEVVEKFERDKPYCEQLYINYGPELIDTIREINSLLELDRLDDENIRLLRIYTGKLDIIFSDALTILRLATRKN